MSKLDNSINPASPIEVAKQYLSSMQERTLMTSLRGHDDSEAKTDQTAADLFKDLTAMYEGQALPAQNYFQCVCYNPGWIEKNREASNAILNRLLDQSRQPGSNPKLGPWVASTIRSKGKTFAPYFPNNLTLQDQQGHEVKVNLHLFALQTGQKTPSSSIVVTSKLPESKAAVSTKALEIFGDEFRCCPTQTAPAPFYHAITVLANDDAQGIKDLFLLARHWNRTDLCKGAELEFANALYAKAYKYAEAHELEFGFDGKEIAAILKWAREHEATDLINTCLAFHVRRAMAEDTPLLKDKSLSAQDLFDILQLARSEHDEVMIPDTERNLNSIIQECIKHLKRQWKVDFSEITLPVKHFYGIDNEAPEKALMAIVKASPGQKIINLTNFYYMTDAVVEAIVKNSPDLFQVDISYCPRVTGKTFRFLCNTLKRLTNLTFMDGKGVSQATVKGASLEKLKSLSISRITDLAVAEICHHAPKLQHLHLLDSRIKNDCWAYFSWLKQLKSLMLCRCPMISQTSPLRSGLPKHVKISIEG